MPDQTGTPYTVGEVEQVIAKHTMDPYHRELMRWLLTRVADEPTVSGPAIRPATGQDWFCLLNKEKVRFLNLKAIDHVELPAPGAKFLPGWDTQTAAIITLSCGTCISLTAPEWTELNALLGLA